jgi:hypothetical protein
MRILQLDPLTQRVSLAGWDTRGATGSCGWHTEVWRARRAAAATCRLAGAAGGGGAPAVAAFVGGGVGYWRAWVQSVQGWCRGGPGALQWESCGSRCTPCLVPHLARHSLELAVPHDRPSLSQCQATLSPILWRRQILATILSHLAHLASCIPSLLCHPDVLPCSDRCVLYPNIHTYQVLPACT